MTDYQKASGTGYILIRDTGNLVQFFFKAGYASDYYNGLPFQIIINGVTLNKTINYAKGANQVMVYSATVSYTQTVTFKMTATTHISGIGGPTTLSATITRGSSVPLPPLGPLAPDAPVAPFISNIGVESMATYTTTNYDGGSAITGWDMSYGINPDASNVLLSNIPNFATVHGLAMGTVYYFKYRARNSVGTSAWSAISSAKTYLGAYVNVGGVWRVAIPYVKSSGSWRQAEPIVERS